MKNKKIEEAIEELDWAINLLSSRIVENNTNKEKSIGMYEQATHAFLLYRDHIEKAKEILQKLIGQR